MGLLQAVRTRVASDDTIYECRHCGVTVSREAETCPTCDSTEIARYHC